MKSAGNQESAENPAMRRRPTKSAGKPAIRRRSTKSAGNPALQRRSTTRELEGSTRIDSARRTIDPSWNDAIDEVENSRQIPVIGECRRWSTTW